MNDEMFLGTTGLNTVFDNPDSVTEVASAVIDDKLVQVFTDQSNL
jgi:hypothetical protein